ncbi:MAG: c-type cytochrome [Chloracidobacterium sp.]|nr:c-type cytochrome [Chloracidobacterium sp.]
MKYLKLALIAATAAIFIAACGQAANTPVVNNTAPKANQNAATPAPVAEVASGQELYAKNCMICHKDTGKGGKVTIEGKSIDPDDITTAKMKEKADEKFVGYINDGFPDDGMPAFKDKLTADQVKAIIKHIRTLQGS